MPERSRQRSSCRSRATWIAAEQRAATPWFAWVHLFDPHAPYQPPPPFDTQYAGRPYDGEVAATDAALAPLLDDVAHGGSADARRGHRRSRRSARRSRRATHGLFAYESTLRVPLIVAESEPPTGARAARARRSSTCPCAMSTSCRRSSTPSDNRRRRICRTYAAAAAERRAARRRARRTSRRWRRCSTAGGRR